MGYTTDFEGNFELDKQLSEAHSNYLVAFNRTRRMKRDPEKAALLPDPLREAVGLPIGIEGEFYVGSYDDGDMGQSKDDSILEYNDEPSTQHGLWCQWTPTKDGNGIGWDYGEKFYHYVEWLEYIVENFLKPWGYVLNGSVQWQGEESNDIGEITVEDNEVRVGRGEVYYNY